MFRRPGTFNNWSRSRDCSASICRFDLWSEFFFFQLVCQNQCGWNFLCCGGHVGSDCKRCHSFSETSCRIKWSDDTLCPEVKGDSSHTSRKLLCSTSRLSSGSYKLTVSLSLVYRIRTCRVESKVWVNLESKESLCVKIKQIVFVRLKKSFQSSSAGTKGFVRDRTRRLVSCWVHSLLMDQNHWPLCCCCCWFDTFTFHQISIGTFLCSWTQRTLSCTSLNLSLLHTKHCAS